MSLSDLSFEKTPQATALSSKFARAQLEPITFLKSSLDSQSTAWPFSKKVTRLNSSNSIPFNKENLYFLKDEKSTPKLSYQKNKHYLILKNHLKGKIKSPAQKKNILAFVKLVISHFEEKQKEAVTDIIGQIIFLTDRHFQRLVDCLELKDLEKSITNIQKLFQGHLDIRVKKVEDWIKRQETLEAHEAQIFSHNRIPVEISEFILTKQGLLNQALIPHIISVFNDSEKETDSFKQNLLRKLLFLKNSEKASQLIQSINLSPRLHSPARQVIRTVLKLSNQTTLTHTHAKKAALAAFLSHFRQPVSGGCFANSLSIELLSSKFLSCLNDFKQLLYTNTLTRVVKSQKRVFPFLISTHYHDLDKTLEIDPSGKVNGKGFIWEDPGIESVCKALKIESSKAKIIEALKLKKNAGIVTYTMREVLTRLGDYSTRRRKLSVSQVYGLYESKKTNLLLQAWNNAIAGMAEADDGSMIKSTVIRSVLFALNINFTSPFIPYEKMHTYKKKLMDFLENELSTRIQFLYDANIANEHHSPGFILYDRNQSDAFHRWDRVDSEQSFQKFLKSVLDHYDQTISDDKIARCLTRGLKRYVETNTFIERLLHDYHASWLGSHDKKKEELEFTPWKTLSGNNALKVIQIYFEKEQLPRQKAILPKSAPALLKELIDYGRQFLINPKTFPLYPVRVLGLHSFSLALWHPSLTRLIRSTNADEIIAQHQSLIKNEITEVAIELPIQKAIIDTLKSNPLFKETSIQSKEFIFPEPITYKAFRALLLDQISHSAPELTAMEWVIDTVIYGQMPEIKKQILLDTAITFADTNWNYGSSDIYFCFVTNPFTGKMELWENLSHDKLLQPLNQEFWLKNRTWEFLENPDQYFEEEAA